MARSRIGFWLIGAKGGVASTAITGLLALRKGLTDGNALTSCRPEFADLDLADWKNFVIGGHEIRDLGMFDAAWQMHSVSKAIDADLLLKLKPELNKLDKSIKPGTVLGVGSTITNLASSDVQNRRETHREALNRISNDLKEFVKDNSLDRLIVVNVSSTEPPLDIAALPPTWNELAKTLDKPKKCALSASSLYAIAALDQGHAFLNFTPSPGSTPPALHDLAEQRGAVHMGYDGKTGETLLKSTLAPMFAKRNLGVMSWVGHNIFGNMDGKVLDDPINKAAKVTSKDRLLRKIFGYTPQTLVSIEYIESMGDWKTAWDHIHFKGFLGTPMVMQFLWQGCDSILAAPLVLDLLRFTELAMRRGEKGPLKFLASFFKSPLGVDEHDFAVQYQWLLDWAKQAK